MTSRCYCLRLAAICQSSQTCLPQVCHTRLDCTLWARTLQPLPVPWQRQRTDEVMNNGARFEVFCVKALLARAERMDKSDPMMNQAAAQAPPPNPMATAPPGTPVATAVPGQQPVLGPDGKPLKERTFIEKNWMLLAAMAFLGLNLAMRPPPASAPAASAGGSQVSASQS